jgi:hypothetical protein
VVLVLSLASTSLAAVIGNFEADAEGWYVPGNPNVSLLFSTVGATLDFLSLKVQVQAGGWQDAIALDLVGQDALIAAFLENSVLALDVTRLASEWQGHPENGYSQMFMVVNAGGAGWTVWDQHVSGDWTPDQGDQTQTLLFDYSSVLSQININSLWWFEIRLVVYYDDGYTLGGTYYLDNVRLLAEDPRKIIWVSDALDVDEDGMQDDQGWIRMLRAAGHEVDTRPDYWRELDSGKMDELNEADLVIVSRASISANYASNDEEVSLWNGVTTPLIQTNAYMLRSNRWQWLDSPSQANLSAPTMVVSAIDHAVFSNVFLGTGDQAEVLDTSIVAETSFPVLTEAGQGLVLASSASGNVWIAEWDQGVEFYQGAGQFPGGQRMMFMAGTQEISGATPQGVMNLTKVGQQMFLNAVTYMLTYNIIDPGTENLVHAYRFDDGTARDSVGQAHGILNGNAQIRNGALITGQQGDWMAMPGPLIALNRFEGITLEAWYTPSEGVNTEGTMLAYFGDSGNAVGHDHLFMSAAGADDVSRTAISVGNAVSPRDAESGANGPEYDDGVLHHMVATVNETHIALYLDGKLIDTSSLSENNRISGISPDVAWLARSGYQSDPQWIGQIHEFNIYNRALEPGEVMFLAGR